MKIELFGDKDLVVQATAQRLSVGMSFLIILADSDCQAHYAGGCLAYMNTTDKVVAKHRTFQVAADDGRTCDVVFIAEDEQESATMDGLVFGLREKDQSWNIVIDRELFLDNKTVATLDCPLLHNKAKSGIRTARPS